ncbi:MAG: hypothetical protein ACE5H9_12210 [Anaerolineae bacterium]
MLKCLRIIGLAVGVLLLAPAAPALAQGPESGDQVVFGADIDLVESDVVRGSVIVFGGNVDMDPGSRVQGDLIVFGGNGDIDGEVGGSLVFIGSSLDLGDTAHILGDVSTVGSRVFIDESARIEGTVVDLAQLGTDFGETVSPALPRLIIPSRPAGLFTLIGRIVGDGIQNVLTALVLAGFGVLLMLLIPDRANNVAAAVSRSPLVTFIMGFISLLAASAILILLGLFSWLLFPICGILLLGLALAAAGLFGWTAVGTVIGERLWLALKWPKTSRVTVALVGIALLSAVWLMPFVDQLPGIGGLFTGVGLLVSFVAGSIGLGAVILTRFGSQIYVPASGDSPQLEGPAADEAPSAAGGEHIDRKDENPL